MIISDWSSDLCSSHLYSCPQTFSRTAPRVAIRSKAHMSSTAISELLHGEMLQAIDIAGGWAWGYCVPDNYVGYIAVDTLGKPVHIGVETGRGRESQCGLRWGVAV